MLNLIQVAAAEAVGTFRANMLRTLLSMLGIIIGVGALVAILGLGDGLENFGRMQLGDRTEVASMLVMPVTSESVDGIYLEKQNVVPLTPTDAQAIMRHFGDQVKDIEMMTGMKGWVRLESDTTNRPCALAFSLKTPFADTLRALQGRLFEPADFEPRDSVVVLNHLLARRLRPDSNFAALIGQHLVWEKYRFRISGVLTADHASSEEEKEVPMLYAPIQVLRPEELKSRPPALKLSARNVEEIPAMKTELERWLAADGRGGTANFMVRTNDYWVGELKKGIMVFKIVMGLIIGIAIVVGGIGIMNVLLMSVTERTREIGIRKALGAKRKAIALQFLTESLALSVAGCLLGLVLGLLFNFSATPLVMHLAEVKGFKATIAPSSFLVVMV
ncbi:MAG TPA: ABC transporter permease, partial [Saprospiraceae bacterium]|nr:ABC transporter permease [Saprospiraceae bacterium]